MIRRSVFFWVFLLLLGFGILSVGINRLSNVEVIDTPAKEEHLIVLPSSENERFSDITIME